MAEVMGAEPPRGPESGAESGAKPQLCLLRTPRTRHSAPRYLDGFPCHNFSSSFETRGKPVRGAG